MNSRVSKARGTFFVTCSEMGVVRVSRAYVLFSFYAEQRLLFRHHTKLYKQASDFQEGTVSFVGFLLYHRYSKYYLENSF